MPHDRFFLDTPFELHTSVLLTGEEAHHLQQVMRKKEGENVELVNGRHQLALAQILTFQKKAISLQILHIEKSPPSPPLILCQAIPRLNRLDTIVEKGTELGMTELRLFPGLHSEKKELSPTQFKRLEGITISSMKQCGRLDLPKISLYSPLLQWTKADCPYPAYFGDVRGKQCFACSQGGVLFFVGPESGFTPKEEEHFKALGVEGVRLHPYILRTDTAAITALSLLSQSLFANA